MIEKQGHGLIQVGNRKIFIPGTIINYGSNLRCSQKKIWSLLIYKEKRKRICLCMRTLDDKIHLIKYENESREKKYRLMFIK